MAKMRVALYCRVASADQMAMDAQEATLRCYASEHGYDVKVCCTDNGFSGLRLDNRPGFAELNAAIAAGEIDAVLVRNETRIGRNFPQVDGWIDGLKERGVQFITSDYPYAPPVFPAEILTALCRGKRRSGARRSSSVSCQALSD